MLAMVTWIWRTGDALVSGEAYYLKAATSAATPRRNRPAAATTAIIFDLLGSSSHPTAIRSQLRSRAEWGGAAGDREGLQYAERQAPMMRGFLLLEARTGIEPMYEDLQSSA
jgi:hypothetical protein